MNKEKRNIVEWAMHYRQIIILVTCCLVAFGIYGLGEMKKNEFPDFTVRQGLVVAAYPGATAAEIEEQVTKPLEDYIFSYKEVKKSKTHSRSQDGMAIIQVELNDELKNKDEFWSKFKHGISTFKSQLPSGVLAVQVMDDFGDTSALLITMESEDKTYRELKDYVDDLKDRLRRVESVGRMSVYGMQKEQISIYLDSERLSHYGISDKSLGLTLFTKGFTTMSGRLKNDSYTTPIYVGKSLNTVHDISELIVYSDPMGNNIRLKDVARVVREYPEPDSYITNNGKKCLLLSVEMKKGKNIVKMGEDVQKEMDEFAKQLPTDVHIYKITDQKQVVSDSVENFLHELCIAIVAVVIVVMLLLPMRVALVAASTIPISIFVAIGLFYAFGIELNTVTLAALIVTLGMIVDNSIVIIDSYLEMISDGKSRWHASIDSATHFFKSILSATLAISITFFPFLFTTRGIIQDFLQSFPWAITLILLISLLVAELLVPFMQFYFIRKPMAKTKEKKARPSFLGIIQQSYNKLLDTCFSYPKTTIAAGAVSVILGALIFTTLPQKLLPVAERNQFAVEIFMPTGTSLDKTVQIADSLSSILRKDKRVLSVASFNGCSSPRFHTAYAPQLGGSNFAQFVVNTTDNKATEEVLDEYAPIYSQYFPGANIKFKQLVYSFAANPVEVRITGENYAEMKRAADEVMRVMRSMPELTLVRSDLNEPQSAVRINLREDDATRLGISNLSLEAALATRYSAGFPIGTVWDGDYDTPIVLKGTHADSAETTDLRDEKLPASLGLAAVPLRQVADIEPLWIDGQICRRNGIRTITVIAEPARGANVMSASRVLKDKLAEIESKDGVNITLGGEYEENGEYMPQIIMGLIIAVAIIFTILLAHFKRVSTATLILACLSLCLFGAVAGAWIQGVDFGVTCILGMISLMGILVRNGIIMIDYAEELRSEEGMTAKDAIYHSARRRMRPIFLTSAAASMGVIPMILGGSGLWMPMGTVIFYGTLITMVFILTVMPVAYWLVMSGTTKTRIENSELEKE
ncbi:MAG: efflux RND transporter permease subunit [Prevotellaceae bacterium]|nr:efflux RND transporter permease subunit [Prevotellaceae bacterium]